MDTDLLVVRPYEASVWSLQASARCGELIAQIRSLITNARGEGSNIVVIHLDKDMYQAVAVAVRRNMTAKSAALSLDGIAIEPSDVSRIDLTTRHGKKVQYRLLTYPPGTAILI